MNIPKVFFPVAFVLGLLILICSCSKDNEEEKPIEKEPDDGSISGTITEPLVFSKISTEPGVADYYITGILSVESELTIDTGVVIEMGPAAGILIKNSGAIIAKGTANNPITITGRTKNRGFWNYIMVNSSDPRNELRYVNIEYGGGDTSNDGAVYLNTGAYLKIHNCNINNSLSHGVVAADVNSKLDDFSHNTLAHNNLPLKIRPTQIPDIALNNTFNDNDSSYINVIGAPVVTPMTWTSKPIPYIFRGVTTIEADVEMTSGFTAFFDFAAAIRVNPSGTLKATGAPSDRITLSSLESLQGYWHGIEIKSRSHNNFFNNVDISYAGGSADKMGAVYIGGSVSYPEAILEMSNSNITYSASWGVYVRPNAGFVNSGGNNFSNNIFGNIGP